MAIGQWPTDGLAYDARDALVNRLSCEDGFVVSQVQGVFANALSV